MSTDQLTADVRTLGAALYRMQASMGGERFAAARAALGRQITGGQPPATETVAAVANHYAPSTASTIAHSQSDDTAETLALARAAGIGRFAAAEVGSAPTAANPQAAEMDALALIRASGLKGYDLGQSA
ncbi:hypothetical protein NF700_17565 [Sphingomonadaceae bacterium OTU29MARTA1]|nr:hypothetical protein NF700_17565 [Sphingomonadaceae bacterium OTU29MARTA1]